MKISLWLCLKIKNMLSKAKIKYIQSLDLKKNRDSDKVFIAEGFKIVEEFIEKFRCRLLLGTHDWLNAHPHIQAEEIIEVSQEELSRASLQKTTDFSLLILESCLSRIRLRSTGLPTNTAAVPTAMTIPPCIFTVTVRTFSTRF